MGAFSVLFVLTVIILYNDRLYIAVNPSQAVKSKTDHRVVSGLASQAARYKYIACRYL